MKKIFAVLMAVMMIMAMTSVAMAGETGGGEGGDEPAATPEYTSGTAPTGMSAEAAITFTVDKTVTPAGTGASLPAQTFAATQVGSSAYTYVKYNQQMTAVTETGAAITTGVPTVTLTGAAVAEAGTSGLFTITTSGAFPQTGVYTYFFKETDGNIAGTVYDFDEGATSPSEDGKIFAVRITVVNGTDTNAGHLMVGGISVRPAYGTTSGDTTTYAIDYAKEKLGEINNYYNAGQLTISKTVTGNLGDTQKDWNYTVVFTSPTTGDAQDLVKSIITYTTSNTDGTVTATNATVAAGSTAGTGTITATGNGWTSSTVTFTLKSGENIVFSNIPAGVTYTLNEAEAGQDGYTTTISATDSNLGDSNAATITQNGGNAGYSGLSAAPSGNQVTGTITAKNTQNTTQDTPSYTVDADVATYTNDKNVEVDTGISLDTVPYIMIMALAFAGIIVLISKKHREQN